MKIVLAAINSKYIHPNLAIRYLKKYAQQRGVFSISLAEYTINHRWPFILEELYRLKPDVLAFSCYIWNISYVRELVWAFKTVSPNTIIVLGGPEVSFDTAETLRTMPQADYVLASEGEEPFYRLLDCLEKGVAVDDIPSLTYRKNREIIINPLLPIMDMNDVPFPYDDLENLEDKILYYESSRGCPFRCSYCLSSVDKQVRELPLERVYQELQFFLDRNVRQVKFVDRTFNCTADRALAIWTYLRDHDNGITNFHFEITANLLNDEQLALLKTVRPGQFQFEIGVQSANPQTLTAIHRNVNVDKLLSIAQKIDSYGNIHQHLDLIAGLPYEDLASFGRSFDRVFSMRPQQLQLGFLKVLKGSLIFDEIDEFGVVYQQSAPYEVLYTRWLSFDDVLILRQVEEMVELYYNSGRYRHIIDQIMRFFTSPFLFFRQLGGYFQSKGLRLENHTKERLYEILREFSLDLGLPFGQEEEQLCLFDICLHEKPRKLPCFLDESANAARRREIAAFFTPENIEKFLPEYCGEDPKRVAKLAHIQVFARDVSGDEHTVQETALLFNYRRRDLLGNASWQKVTLPNTTTLPFNEKMPATLA